MTLYENSNCPGCLERDNLILILKNCDSCGDVDLIQRIEPGQEKYCRDCYGIQIDKVHNLESVFFDGYDKEIAHKRASRQITDLQYKIQSLESRLAESEAACAVMRDALEVEKFLAAARGGASCVFDDSALAAIDRADKALSSSTAGQELLEELQDLRKLTSPGDFSKMVVDKERFSVGEMAVKKLERLEKWLIEWRDRIDFGCATTGPMDLLENILRGEGEAKNG